MANYVYNRVICSKSSFEKYFFDTNPFGDEIIDDYVKKHPYITFNKLYGVNSINEYREKYGTYIDYSYGYTSKDISNDIIELKFKTRWYYPICAIIKAIELDHNIIWYACEEQMIYISKFSWNTDKIIEEEAFFHDDFENWYEMNEYRYEELDDSDDLVWYYNYEEKLSWKVYEDDDLIKKYKKQYRTN